MGLGEHELEGWEGPTESEVSRDVAIEVREHPHEEFKLPKDEERSCRCIRQTFVDIGDGLFMRLHKGYSVSARRSLQNELG